jgi:hypothetical protein
MAYGYDDFGSARAIPRRDLKPSRRDRRTGERGRLLGRPTR